MNDIVLIILVLGGALGILILVASALQRRSKTKGNLFTTKPSPGMRIIAILLGVIFGGIFLAEFFWSRTIHIVPPFLSVALFGYAFGAEKLIESVQGKGKTKENHDGQ